MAPPRKRLPDGNKNWARVVEPMKGLSLNLLFFAERAVMYLVDAGGFAPMTKAEFATTMGWFDGHNNPNRRRVEDVCNLTRDQDMYELARDTLGGFRIAYSELQGGMTLVDPHGDLSLPSQLRILQGDMLRQQNAKTVNRRRQPVWKASGDSAANTGDHEMARLCWQAESEIKSTGFVSESLVSDFFKVLSSRGLVDTLR